MPVWEFRFSQVGDHKESLLILISAVKARLIKTWKIFFTADLISLSPYQGWKQIFHANHDLLGNSDHLLFILFLWMWKMWKIWKSETLLEYFWQIKVKLNVECFWSLWDDNVSFSLSNTAKKKTISNVCAVFEHFYIQTFRWEKFKGFSTFSEIREKWVIVSDNKCAIRRSLPFKKWGNVKQMSNLTLLFGSGLQGVSVGIISSIFK